MKNIFLKVFNFKGFKEEIETDGFIKVSKYMKENAEDLLSKAQEK